jgi:16S rRNA G1207 methylase RsmC
VVLEVRFYLQNLDAPLLFQTLVVLGNKTRKLLSSAHGSVAQPQQTNDVVRQTHRPRLLHQSPRRDEGADAKKIQETEN